MMPARFEPNGGQRLTRAIAALSDRHAAIDQRDLNVLQRRRSIEKIVSLKNETQIMAAKQRALIARQRRHFNATKPV